MYIFLLYNIMEIIIYFVIIITILTFTYISYYNGKTFYDTRKKNKKTTHKVYDIGHKYLPDYSNNNLWHVVVNLFVFFPLLMNLSIFEDFISYIIPIMIFRSITSNVTILPKTKTCDDIQFRPINLIHGHCYDKIFSGHFVSSVLISMLLYSKGIVQNIPILVFYNIISAYLILITRHHYTIDIIIAGYVAITSFLLGINMDFVKNLSFCNI